MRQALTHLLGVALLGVGTAAVAESPTQGDSQSGLKAKVKKLREQVQQQSKEIDRLRAKTEESWPSRSRRSSEMF